MFLLDGGGHIELNMKLILSNLCLLKNRCRQPHQNMILFSDPSKNLSTTVPMCTIF